MNRAKPLPFTRYIWCDACNTFEAHNESEAHQNALMSDCPRCGSNDICSRPPEVHEKRLLKLSTVA